MFIGIGMALTQRAFGGGAAGPTYSAEATAYFAAMSSQPDAARKTLINDLIVGLKADGVWSLLDLFYLNASHDIQAAGLNAKAPSTFAITRVGTLTFTADRGFVSDGFTGYLDTGYDAALNNINLTQNSNSLFSYVNQSSSTPAFDLTWGNPANRLTLTPHINTFRARNSSSSEVNFGATTTGLGSRCSSRTGAAIINGQVDGVASGTTQSLASSGLASQPSYLLRSSGNFNARDRLAVAALGGGLTGAQMTALHNRVLTYLTAIGAN